MKYSLLLFLFPLMLFGQDQDKLDSLNGLLESAEHDTTRAKILLKIGNEYKKGLPEEAMEKYEQALSYAQNIHSKRLQAGALGGIGTIYIKQGKHDLALDYYSRSLNLNEELDDKKGIAGNLSNIGNIYLDQNNYEQAKVYYSKSLNISENMGNKTYMSITLHNIGLVYKAQGKYEQALKNYLKCLKIDEEQGNMSGKAYSLDNIGLIYKEQGNYELALEYCMKSLKMRESIGYKLGMAYSLSSIGEIYYLKNNITKAISLAYKGLEISQELGYVEQIKLNSKLLFKAYKKSGNYKKALEMHQLFIEMQDSMLNEDLQKKMLRFDFERKMFEKDKVLAIKQKEIEKQEIQTQYGYAIGGLVILILLTVALFIYRSYRNKARSNQQILEKNKQLESINLILDEKNKDIMSNITYAKKIQDAILPSAETMKSVIPDSFTLYLPKDVVSGDFYWVYKDKQGVAYFTVGDCTGHGVSGAFMSIIGQTLLNEIIVNKGVTEVNEILMQMRTYIIRYLGQKGEAGEARDGMDIALCKMDISQKKLSYAGAYNSLYRISGGVLTEYKGSRRPVGYFIGKSIPFEKEEVDVQKGDLLYIFSDGYADQFGGPKGKKFMFGKFKKLLLSIHEKEMAEQKRILDEILKEWMKGYEQIDDICVMGVRV